MRARSILSEAARNLLSGTSHALLFALVLAGAAAALAITDARSALDVRRSAREYVAAGAAVRVLVAKGTTDGAACDRLRNVSGVDGAGALRETAPVVVRAMPDNPVPAYAITPGLLTVLGNDPLAAPGGAWISRQLADALGARPGQELATTTGTMRVSGIYEYPDDGRDLRLAYAALLPEPATGAFDECWARIWPVSPARADLMATALIVDTSSRDPVTTGRLNTRLGADFDGAARFEQRTTRYAPAGCALLGLVLGVAAVWIRRLELAGALHLGVSRRAMLLTVLLETAVWAAAGLLLAACVLVLGGALDVYAVAVRGPLAAAVCALAGAVLAAAAVRERQLFAYFKDR